MPRPLRFSKQFNPKFTPEQALALRFLSKKADKDVAVFIRDSLEECLHLSDQVAPVAQDFFAQEVLLLEQFGATKES